jgi:hypothetical protein
MRLLKNLLPCVAVLCFTISAIADEPKPVQQGAAAASESAKSQKPYFYIVAADPQLLWGQKDDRNWQTAVDHIAGVNLQQQPHLDGVDLARVIAGDHAARPAMGFWHNFTGGQGTWSDRLIKQLMEAQKAGKPNPLPDRLLKNVNQFPNYPEGNFKGHAAWTRWPWKLHRIQRGGNVRVELYHLKKDPMETKDLAKSEGKRATTMRAELESWQSSVLKSHEGKDYPVPVSK